ncbi:glycoside hydrolase family 38 N-terminal domain-containing protein [Cohnella rhizosphaerae]|uniref:Glycoside hydrolase family 38 N-terminal domain-containing protein n=1 Tax=Cohnella rhizosphaerae TaxID=1457232 RepID=A0A9X4KSB1_9BACL|nr:hypothetical protein [Cohnella rhizosphaerae]MDG0810244.1 hypothetical protein [Cohnella rhizosphaerae]
MGKTKAIHLVSHTHWDREWYLPFETFRFRLVGLIDRLLDTMERQPGYRFHLDGQTIVLEDYLELRPERRDALKRLVSEGRLSIGPWYVLMDEFLVSGESILRNLEEGRRSGGGVRPAAAGGLSARHVRPYLADAAAAEALWHRPCGRMARTERDARGDADRV